MTTTLPVDAMIGLPRRATSRSNPTSISSNDAILYAGTSRRSRNSTAEASNRLYRTNLARGQTGLSVAFDLPTQTGYDPDDPKDAVS